MLDHFTILTSGGLVLWSRSFTPTKPPLDSLIRSALIEQRTSPPTNTLSSSSDSSSSVIRFDSDQSTCLYSFENSLPISPLIFVVTFSKILANNLNYPKELIEFVKKDWKKFQNENLENLKLEMKGNRTLSSTSSRSGGEGKNEFEWNGFEERFERVLKTLEDQESNKSKRPKTRSMVALESSTPTSEPSPPETPSEQLTLTTTESEAQTIARNIAALKARQKAASRATRNSSSKKLGGVGGGGSGTDTDSNYNSESDAGSPGKPLPPKKTATKWSDSNISASDLAQYDYSTSPRNDDQEEELEQPTRSTVFDTRDLVSEKALGKRDDQTGMYQVAEYQNDSSEDEDEKEEEEETKSSPSSNPSLFSSLFSKLSLSSSSSSTSSTSSKTLTKQDLSPILSQLQSLLISKNVASPIATSLIQSLSTSLQGKTLPSSGSFLSTRNSNLKRLIKQSLNESLTKILTPKNSIDLLLEISLKKQKQQSQQGGGGVESDPYSIAFVGVNGVGKSTNLSKVAFWLLQNQKRVLIAACDTFRSGAVEQLRVHVKNLSKLDTDLSNTGGSGGERGGKVELFEKGYGKDAAGIAKEALNYAKNNGFDVVLIDTAGRLQGNEPLMRALAKLVSVNQPDKVIFVGEALVGNDSVDQLTKFDRSLKDFSSSSSGSSNNKKEARGIDGMILTKFDTIDDKVGAALSMTYTTGQPIYFVGCGQTYSDLRMLRVGHIVQALLQE
ncbi:hypothetical protein JCM3765_006276 [Sporobolomyces pararoseus]